MANSDEICQVSSKVLSLQYYSFSKLNCEHCHVAFDKLTLLLPSRNERLLITVKGSQNAFELTVMKA